MEIKLIIDEKEIKTKLGEKILWVCLDNGIYIPNLCAIRERESAYGACRLCLVEREVDGKRNIVSSCSEPAQEGMKIYTQTEKVKRLQRTAFELLMNEHFIDCVECAGRDNCQLLKISAFLKTKIEPKRFRKLERNLSIDTSSPEFVLNPNKCIKCAKCIFLGEQLGKKELNFANRGIEISISTFDHIPLADLDKKVLTSCAEVCPSNALRRNIGHGSNQSNTL